MNGMLEVIILQVEGSKLKAMAKELQEPSFNQKITEELYSLREQNENLKKQLDMVKHDRRILKNAVESGISIIVSTSYPSVNDEGKRMLDKYRTEIGTVLKISDLVETLIREE